MSDRYELRCPRCDKTTNHTVRLRIDYERGEPVFKAWQVCGNCELQRQGTIEWLGWTFEECNQIPWYKIGGKSEDTTG